MQSDHNSPEELEKSIIETIVLSGNYPEKHKDLIKECLTEGTIHAEYDHIFECEDTISGKKLYEFTGIKPKTNYLNQAVSKNVIAHIPVSFNYLENDFIEMNHEEEIDSVLKKLKPYYMMFPHENIFLYDQPLLDIIEEHKHEALPLKNHEDLYKALVLRFREILKPGLRFEANIPVYEPLNIIGEKIYARPILEHMFELEISDY